MENSKKKYQEMMNNLEIDSLPKKGALFIWGILLYSVSFNLFFSPNDIVTGGSTGLGLIINEIYEIDISSFVLIFSVITLLIGFFLLGLKSTIRTISGVLLHFLQHLIFLEPLSRHKLYRILVSDFRYHLVFLQ